MKLPNRIKRDKEIDKILIKAYRLHPHIGTRTLADKFKLSRCAIRRMLRENGEPPKKSTGQDRGFSMEIEAKLDSLYLEAEELMNRQILIRFGEYEHQEYIQRECISCKQTKPFTKKFFSQNYDPDHRPYLRNVCITCFSRRSQSSQKKSKGYRIKRSVKSQIGKEIIDKNYCKTFTLLGYSLDDLMKYLEERFKPGMTWANYGLKGWHIDHIRPTSSFSFESKSDREFKEWFALRNLQPLWSHENHRKLDKLVFNWEYDLNPLAEELFQLS